MKTKQRRHISSQSDWSEINYENRYKFAIKISWYLTSLFFKLFVLLFLNVLLGILKLKKLSDKKVLKKLFFKNFEVGNTDKEVF